MRDKGVIYVAGHPLLNSRCTRLSGRIHLRNDLYRVEWGVKLYSLTHSLASVLRRKCSVFYEQYSLSVDDVICGQLDLGCSRNESLSTYRAASLSEFLMLRLGILAVHADLITY